MATKTGISFRCLTVITSTVLLISIFALATGQNNLSNEISDPSVSQESFSANLGELESFTDQEILKELNSSGVPGVAVAVVKDGAVLLAKGYGSADRETNKPVSVDQTLFRIASVTKLFTWTAVMQLVEQGKLELNRDVNQYLNTFQVPKTYTQPITLQNLMSHNAGFESDEALGWVPSAADLLPLGDYLARYMPARVRSPGEVSVYSNYGASLAGYIVEQVSGMPFEEYIQANILEPLGMVHTSLQQPLPADLALDISMSYIFSRGSAEAVPFGNYMGAPAGAMCSTAMDMTRFMLAHLGSGVYKGSRILQNATVEQMHSQLFTMDPRVPGFAHGFIEYNINGQRIIGHFGGLDAFRSALMLIPEQNLGWFIVYNGEGDAASPGSFFTAFLNHYFPADPYVPPNPPADFSQRANQFTGYFRDARLSHSTFQKLTSLFIEFEVTITKQGTLLVRGQEYVEADSSLFRPYSASNPWNDTLVFLKAFGGQMQYFSNTAGVFERVGWYETSAFVWPLVAICFAFFVSALVILLAKTYVKLGKSKNRVGVYGWVEVASWLLGAYSFFFIISVVGLRFAAGNLSVWYAVMVSGTVGSVLTLASVLFVALLWANRYWSLRERLYWSVVTAVGLVFVWFLYNWNLF